jgi:hypothetical protein
MTIPEAQLDIWANIGAVASSRDTYATIKNALEAPDAAYAGKTIASFCKGRMGTTRTSMQRVMSMSS